MSPEELTKENLSAALDGADIVYFDVRLHDTALVVAQEVIIFSHLTISFHSKNSLQIWDVAPNRNFHFNDLTSDVIQKPFLAKFSPCCYWDSSLFMGQSTPVQASQRKIPILIDAEKKREGLAELLNFASYVVCSAKFPQVSCSVAEMHNYWIPTDHCQVFPPRCYSIECLHFSWLRQNLYLFFVTLGSVLLNWNANNLYLCFTVVSTL